MKALFVNYYRIILEKDRKNTLFAVFLFSLVPLMLLMSGIDSREVNGISTWIKPIKFALSIGIYLMTISGVVHLLNLAERRKRRLLNIVFWVMVIEYLLLVVQASRGVASHFNNKAFFDMIVFNLMGVCIVINTIVLVIVAVRYFMPKCRNTAISDSLWLAIQLGLLIVLFSSAIGSKMVGLNHHAVNPEQYRLIIPFFDWKIGAGDLRISHFIGMHAFQLLPIMAVLLQKWTKLSNRKSYWLIMLLGVGYFLLTLSIFLAHFGIGFTRFTS